MALGTNSFPGFVANRMPFTETQRSGGHFPSHQDVHHIQTNFVSTHNHFLAFGGL